MGDPQELAVGRFENHRAHEEAGANRPQEEGQHERQKAPDQHPGYARSVAQVALGQGMTLAQGVEVEGFAAGPVLGHLLAVDLQVDDIVEREDRGVAREGGHETHDDGPSGWGAAQEHRGESRAHGRMRDIQDRVRHARESEELLEAQCPSSL